MTREEAIKVLEKQFDKSCGNYRYQNAEKLDFEDALWVAISAIRQQEHFREVTKKVEPLTLDELREMNGDPVWVEFQDGSGGCWGLVHITVFNHIVFANGLFCTVGKPYYGKTWLAYCQKPEEGAYVRT